VNSKDNAILIKLSTKLAGEKRNPNKISTIYAQPLVEVSTGRSTNCISLYIYPIHEFAVEWDSKDIHGKVIAMVRKQIGGPHEVHT
jgi:hypothetical protein